MTDQPINKPETCPKCGAEYERFFMNHAQYACGSRQYYEAGERRNLREGYTCLVAQLATALADKEWAELDAKAKGEMLALADALAKAVERVKEESFVSRINQEARHAAENLDAALTAYQGKAASKCSCCGCAIAEGCQICGECMCEDDSGL